MEKIKREAIPILELVKGEGMGRVRLVEKLREDSSLVNWRSKRLILLLRRWILVETRTLRKKWNKFYV